MAFSARIGVYPRYFLIMLAGLMSGCLTKNSPQLAPPLLQATVEDSSARATQPAEAIAKWHSPAATNHQASMGHEAIKHEASQSDLAPLQPSNHEYEEALDPQQVLENGLEICQEATDLWKLGKLDEALHKLDLAYESVLLIGAVENPDIIQGKEDLRLMISKRVVEIHSSRRMTAGGLERAIPIVMNKHVAREIKSFQRGENTFFKESYARSGKYRPMILAALREEGLPDQLSWLPLIESGFKTRALSRARALGPWQFIPSTGYRYGLSRSQWIDERMDPEKSTRAAIAYLHELHDMFGDWLSALAAYNCGENRVMRAIKTQRINYLDNFWDLYNKLPRETVRYVPRFLATLIILEDPEKYGITLPEPMAPEDYTSTEINRVVHLKDLDELAGLPKGTFQKLNPELRHKMTPNKPYQLKIPTPSKDTVIAGLDRIKQRQLPADSYMVHRVRSGETLSTIARRYRTTVTRIVNHNNLRSRHRIRLGQRLKIPSKGIKAKQSIATQAKHEKPRTESKTAVHVVQRGDSLWLLARKYSTSVDRIKALNHLRSNNLKLGQQLTINGTHDKQQGRTYKVKRGDTLANIAMKHRVKLAALLKANNLTKRDKIFPKQELHLPQ